MFTYLTNRYITSTPYVAAAWGRCATNNLPNATPWVLISAYKLHPWFLVMKLLQESFQQHVVIYGITMRKSTSSWLNSLQRSSLPCEGWGTISVSNVYYMTWLFRPTSVHSVKYRTVEVYFNAAWRKKTLRGQFKRGQRPTISVSVHSNTHSVLMAVQQNAVEEVCPPVALTNTIYFSKNRGCWSWLSWEKGTNTFVV